jgi:hypothetical protein
MKIIWNESSKNYKCLLCGGNASTVLFLIFLRIHLRQGKQNYFCCNMHDNERDRGDIKRCKQAPTCWHARSMTSRLFFLIVGWHCSHCEGLLCLVSLPLRASTLWVQLHIETHRFKGNCSHGRKRASTFVKQTTLVRGSLRYTHSCLLARACVCVRMLYTSREASAEKCYGLGNESGARGEDAEHIMKADGGSWE